MLWALLVQLSIAYNGPHDRLRRNVVHFAVRGSHRNAHSNYRHHHSTTTWHPLLRDVCPWSHRIPKTPNIADSLQLSRPAGSQMRMRLTYSYEIRCESHKVTVTSMAGLSIATHIHYDWCN